MHKHFECHGAAMECGIRVLQMHQFNTNRRAIAVLRCDLLVRWLITIDNKTCFIIPFSLNAYFVQHVAINEAKRRKACFECSANVTNDLMTNELLNSFVLIFKRAQN